MTRPPAPTPPPDCVIRARVAGDRWRTAAGRQCSRLSGHPPTRCTQPAVLELNRPRYLTRPARRTIDHWHGYCAGHAADYGRWVEAGRVMEWYAVPVEDATATL